MTEPDQILEGRVALVTGASGGIGSAICRLLASRGACVAAAYGSSPEPARALAEELDGSRAFGADLADREGPAALVEEVRETFGAVDVLIVNHGHARVVDYETLEAADFDHTLAVNLRAPFLLARAVLPGMRERGFGRILFISSGAAFTGGVIGPDYASSKAGLHGLTYFLAGRTAKDGVTVNALAPGFIETPMLPGDPEELASRVPVGRVGTAEEVADLSLAIVRNGYLTGHVLSLDGGMYPR